MRGSVERRKEGVGGEEEGGWWIGGRRGAVEKMKEGTDGEEKGGDRWGGGWRSGWRGRRFEVIALAIVKRQRQRIPCCSTCGGRTVCDITVSRDVRRCQKTEMTVSMLMVISLTGRSF